MGTGWVPSSEARLGGLTRLEKEHHPIMPHQPNQGHQKSPTSQLLLAESTQRPQTGLSIDWNPHSANMEMENHLFGIGKLFFTGAMPSTSSQVSEPECTEAHTPEVTKGCLKGEQGCPEDPLTWGLKTTPFVTPGCCLHVFLSFPSGLRPSRLPDNLE